MAKIYGALEVAQLEWFTDAGKPAANTYIYRVIYVSDLKQVQVSDGTNWIPFLNTSTNQTVSGNITFAGQQIFNGLHRLSVTTDSSSTGAITALNNVTPVTEFTAAVTSISGIANSASGATVMLVNRTGSTFSVLDEDAGASAANRIRTGTGAPIALANNASIVLTYVGDSRWHIVGGAGAGSGSAGINYIGNGSAEADTSGWATYADAAGTSPVDGTGGSPSVTLTRSTTSPLIGTASFIFTKGASNLQGQGASYDFTIDAAYKAKVLQISFNYLVDSGTFVAGSSTADSDVTVWLYDKTNGVVIQPSSYKLLSNNASIADTFNATFQTASNSTSYRLIFHVGTTSASAYTLKIDGVSVSPSTYVYGTPVTDWQSYTPTFQGFGTPSNVDCRWRRVGDNVELQVKFQNGTPTAVEARVGLPAGLTSSSTKLTTINPTGGVLVFNATGAGSYTALMEPSVTYVTFGVQATSNAGLAKLTGSSLVSAGTYVAFNASVPVQGWSSSVQTSDQTDTRIVAAQYKGNAGGAITADVTNITFSTSNYDTHGAWNGTTFTAPVPGIYQFQGMVAITTSVAIDLWLWKNGVKTFMITENRGVTTSIFGFSGTLQLNAGETMTLRSDTGATLSNSSTNHYININRLSGPSAIAASETVAASYYASANQTSTTSTPINFDTKIDDSHSAVTTGASWKFSAPTSGRYLISAYIYITGTVSAYLRIYKNGVFLADFEGYASSAPSTTAGGYVKLNAGDYIDLRASSSTTFGGGTLGTSDVASWVSIVRVGN